MVAENKVYATRAAEARGCDCWSGTKRFNVNAVSAIAMVALRRPCNI
jgi:hypothetical protein